MWRTTEFRQREELNPDYWEQGFFHTEFGGGTMYKRDFDELKLRDLSVFTLGEIKDKVILDMGCGSGLYSLIFLRLGAKAVCGHDILESAISLTAEKCQNLGFSNFTGAVGDCTELGYEDDKFDLVFSGDLFEHITNQQKEKFINQAYRVLKPGGLFTIKTPNKSYLILTNILHRIKAIIRLQNPFMIHIAHTRDNPDNEHHGLTTHKELAMIFDGTMFHPPVIKKTDFNRGLPMWLSRILGRFCIFNSQIILTVRKPIFYGVYK